jgi:hypothetical protein
MTVNIEVNGIKMECEVEISKAHRGMREYGTGLQLEPDEEAGFEVESTKVISGGFDFNEIASVTHEDIEVAVKKELDSQKPDFDEDDYMGRRYGRSHCASCRN